MMEYAEGGSLYNGKSIEHQISEVLAQNILFSYSKFRNFRENFIVANRVKRHICQVKNLPLWHDLPTSVKDEEFSPFRESFIFAKFHIREVLRK